MVDSSHDPASFLTQANALLRKNLIFQKRNLRINIGLVAFPFLLCFLLISIQTMVNHDLNMAKYRCGCTCIDRNGSGICETACHIEYSTWDQVATCSIPNPPEWPVLLQVPHPAFRAVRTTDLIPFTDLPNESCRRSTAGSFCPAIILVTGGNRSLGESLAGNLFTSHFFPYSSNVSNSFANLIPGTDMYTTSTNALEPAIISNRAMYVVYPQCMPNSSFSVPMKIASTTRQHEVRCVQGINLWRNSSSEINNKLFKGYRQGNPDRKINEILAAYDFLKTNENNFNVSIWYNSTYQNGTRKGPSALVRTPCSINMVSNAYLQFLKGDAFKILLGFVKEMPKAETERRLDFSLLLGALFFTWVVLQLFPVILTSLVYEKQQNLRIMMKMHGLGDRPYWMISYGYFLVLSSVYMLSFVVFGSVIGLKFFTLNDYSIQFVFFFIYVNLQIALSILAATFFSDVKIATVIARICVFGSGLLGAYLLQPFVEDTSFSRGWIIVMELYPGFSLFRGLYELSQYSHTGILTGTSGMQWKNLSDGINGMKEVLIIMSLEWLLVLPVAYYLDQVVSVGSGVRRHPLFFLKKRLPTFQRKPSVQRPEPKVFIEMEKPDVSQEWEKVEQLLLERNINAHVIICDNLKKVYPGRDGNPDKFAVRGLSLALPKGECLGMLGPNGAGKTSFISMITGLTMPTSGTAYIQGLNIQTDMDGVYTSMGVCPQHDLLWETLTGREHLLFYGRLKNLKGSALTEAVEESLKSVNLCHGGVDNKQAGKNSGGMKRRLSVAISLIGDPKVVYMDEPSTGLDPVSRNNLWNVVKRAKQDRAIILTKHSMEEAEVLCDRLGIFVDGSFQCIGRPIELKGRYGGSYVLTMTTSSRQEEEVEKLVLELFPGAKKIYHISGTQKFELPKQEVRIADVFQAVEKAKNKFKIYAWGLTDTTLEDVFIKVVRGIQAFDTL